MTNFFFFFTKKSDDVKQSKFEIVIEFYSYELFNTANNILQSARKLAKQFTDFATFKRNTQLTQINGQNHHQQQQQHSSYFNLSNSTSNYPQSIHKFKLVARATLNQDDLNEQTTTKSLKLVNDSDHHQTNNLATINANIQNQSSATNKLPLFDYYSCRLRISPTSSFI